MVRDGCVAAFSTTELGGELEVWACGVHVCVSSFPHTGNLAVEN